MGINVVWCDISRSTSPMFHYNGQRERTTMILSDDDIKFIKFSKDCIDRGRYSDTTKLTEVYNRCFADRPRFRPIKNTNCGQCIRTRICELYYEMEIVLKKIMVEE